MDFAELKGQKAQNKWDPIYYVLIDFWHLLLAFPPDISWVNICKNWRQYFLHHINLYETTKMSFYKMIPDPF